MNNKKSNAFTLVELLASILILGIIAVIVTIVTTGIIHDSKSDSTTISVKSYISAINSNILSARLRNENIEDGTYKILEDGNLCIGTYANSVCAGNILDVDLTSGVPTSGSVVIEEKRVISVINANINGETISYDAIKEEQIKNDMPEITEFNVISMVDSAKLEFILANAATIECEYGLTDAYGQKGTLNKAKTECVFNKLKPETTYYYRLAITNSDGESDVRTGTIRALSVSTPTIAVTPNEYSTSKVATITYNSTNIEKPYFYLFSTSKATSNIPVTYCGSNIEELECSSYSTTDLAANTWYRVKDAESVEIFYSVRSILIARTNDDVINVGATRAIITDIDNTKPVIAVNNINYLETARVLLSDNESGLNYFAVTDTDTAPIVTDETVATTISTLNKWYAITNSTSEVERQVTGLNAGTYYAWAKDRLGNYDRTKFVVSKISDSVDVSQVVHEYTGGDIGADVDPSSGQTPTITYYSDSACTIETTPVAIGDYYIRVTTPGNNNYNPTTSECIHAVSVTKINLASTASCDSKIYDATSAATCSIQVTGGFSSDNLTATGTCEFNNANVGTDKTVTCNNIILSGSNLDRYNTVSPATTTADINNFTLTFNANNGTLNGSSPLYARKGQAKVFTGLTNSTEGQIPTATRTGYNFDGWNNSSSVKVINANRTLVSGVSGWVNTNGTWLLTSDQTLSARWEPKQLIIRYNKNDGSGATSTETFTYDGNMNDNYLNPPSGYNSRVGYTFAGWSRVASGSDNIRYPFTDVVGETWFLNQVGNNSSVTIDLYAIWADTTPPVLALSKQGVVNGFNGWSLVGSASIDLNNQILTLSASGATGTSPYVDVNEQNYGWSYEFQSSSAATQRPNGGSMTSTYYFDSNFDAKVGSNGYSSNGQSASASALNTWTSVGPSNYNQGSGIKYFRITPNISTNYSNPTTKYRNFKIYGDIYAKDKYTITVSASDAVGTIATKKYASGNQNKDYFANNGITISGNSFDVTSNGTYTVYVADNSGNGTVETITINKIDKTAPSITSYTGKMLNTDPEFASGTNNAAVYNNSTNGTVTVTRKQISGIQNSTGYGLEIKTAGTATPGLGGFVQYTNSYANGVFYHVIVAKIPVGYNIQHAENSTGNGKEITWLTSQAGTGKYETYIYKHKCGSSGTFSNFGHVYITGNAATSSNPVTWYVAYASMFEETASIGDINSIITLANDTESKVVSYAYTTTNSQPTTWKQVQTSSYVGSVYSISSNGTYYAWYMDAAGNTASKPITVSTDPIRIYYHPNGGTVTSNTYTTCCNGWVATNSTTYFYQQVNFGGNTDPYNYTTFGISRTGYSVPDGTEWCTNANGTGTCFDHDVTYSFTQYMNAVTKAKQDGFYELDLYTHWNPNTYTIALNANGGSGGSSSVSIVYGTTQGNYPSISLPSREGYTFNGYWDTSATTGGTQWYNSAGNSLRTFNLTSGTTWYARWTPNVLTVRLHPNGATTNSSGGNVSDPMETATYNYDGTVGYNWPTDYTPPYGYKLVYNGYAGTGVYHVGSASSSTTIGQDFIKDSDGVSVVTLATRLGILNSLKAGNYTLDLYAGWKVNSNALVLNPNGGTYGGSTSNTTVTQNRGTTYSISNPTRGNSTSTVSSYQVSYNSHGGSSNPSAQTATKTSTTSYTFSSWSSSGTCGTMSGTTYTFPFDNGTTCTKTASWTSSSSNSGGTITLPSPGTQSGYTFAGWYTAASGGTRVGGANDSYTPSAAITLHAQWTPLALTMNAPTPSGVTEDSKVLVGSTVTFTCTGQSGNYPASLQISGQTAVTNSSNSASISATYTITSPASSFSISATCTGAKGNTKTVASTATNVYRKFQLLYNKNGAASIGSTSSTAQYLIANSTSSGGSKVALPAVSCTSRGKGCTSRGWDSRQNRAGSSYYNAGQSYDICLEGTSGCSISTTTIPAKNSQNNAVTTLYAITYFKILNPTKTANVTTSTNSASDSTYIYIYNTATSATYTNQCGSSTPHITCLTEANSGGGAYDAAYVEICSNRSSGGCTASPSNSYLVGGTRATNCSFSCRANAGGISSGG